MADKNTQAEKELVYIGASVAAGCKPCTSYHVKKAREAGATDEEIEQATSVAIGVRVSAANVMAEHGQKLLGAAAGQDAKENGENTSRITELISIAAAFAVNCTSSLEKHLAAGRTVGITDDEIKSVLKGALFIKGKAASHVDRIEEKIGDAVAAEEKTEDTCGCGCGEISS
ncbi:MAG: carboxymuconolactone decarboxylase family protein [bacterium]